MGIFLVKPVVKINHFDISFRVSLSCVSFSLSIISEH